MQGIPAVSQLPSRIKTMHRIVSRRSGYWNCRRGIRSATNCSGLRMSARVQPRLFGEISSMSALARFADSSRTSREIREMPKAIVSRCSNVRPRKAELFDYLVLPLLGCRICLEQATQILLPLDTPREVFCKDLLEGLPRIDDERIDARCGSTLLTTRCATRWASVFVF